MAACGAAVPAVAADNDVIVPDASRQATLDIHKLSGTESTTRADGTALAPEEVAKYGKPMGGVVFDVYKVSGIDVSTNEGLKVAEKIHERKVTAADVAAGKISVDGQDYALVKEAQSVTTGGDGSGQGTYGLGVYVVAENLANSAPTIDGTVVGKDKITPSAPFLVSLPMTNPNGRSEWMYGVNVYPKNQVDEITKSVTDVKVGDIMVVETYGEKLTYKVTDIRTVLPSQSDALTAVPGKDLLTLMTCTPYGVNTHRLLVTGERTSNAEGATTEPGVQHELAGLSWMMKAMGTLAVALILAGLMVPIVARPQSRTKPGRRHVAKSEVTSAPRLK